MPVSPDIRKRLLYAKYLLSRAKKDQNDRNELAVAACLLLMHDATELLMLAVTDHLSIGSKWGFMEFWDKVKQSGHKEPGHKIPVGQLNDNAGESKAQRNSSASTIGARSVPES